MSSSGRCGEEVALRTTIDRVVVTAGADVGVIQRQTVRLVHFSGAVLHACRVCALRAKVGEVCARVGHRDELLVYP